MVQKRKPLKKSDDKKPSKAKSGSTDSAKDVSPASQRMLASFTAENVEKFIMGEITWAQLMGITRQEAYAVAEVGYSFYQEARFHDARTVFEGLVIANPYDWYFHNMLGAVYQQLDLKEEALAQYTLAIDLNPSAAHPRINRGEIYLFGGKLEEAKDDLDRALRLSPDDSKEEAVERARMLAHAADVMLKALANQAPNIAPEKAPKKS